ncbi:DnaJ-like protein [Dongia mobilis]|uniref:DnaJ-like protein n=1 Tax=Dongia mobilis TaxID=578943 RepID=A0A4R6WXU2_9PROT|nr:DnaJ-like protein [Dongia mobilis]
MQDEVAPLILIFMSKEQTIRVRRRRHYDPDPPPVARGCDHPECASEGLYRAPKSREKLNDYYWFCLDHVRAYNGSWDYYAGMGPEEIEKSVRSSVVGDRPTWKLGQRSASGRQYKFANGTRFDLFPDEVKAHVEARMGQAKRKAERDAEARARRKLSAEDKALAVLDLTAPVDWDTIKLRYKTLVKQLHPDANGGDREAEERLKVVNQAYSTLKRAAIA